MTFGLIGILLGPTILVVVYTLALAWISESQEAAPARPDGLPDRRRWPPRHARRIRHGPPGVSSCPRS